MNKKVFTFLFLILFIQKPVFLQSLPLELSSDGNSSPFVFLKNPSFIIKENGLSFGSGFTYKLYSESLQNIFGILRNFGNNGFGIAYKNNSIEELNQFLFAYSFFVKRFSVGTTFKYYLSSEDPLLLFDVGFLIHLKNYLSLAIAFKNIIAYDSIQNNNPFMVSLGVYGDVPLLKKAFYFVEANILLSGLYNRIFGYGGSILIQHYFFKNPEISVFYSGEIRKTLNNELFWAAGCMPGMLFTLRKFSFGFYAGGGYYSEKNNAGPYLCFSVFMNPLYGKGIPPLSASLQLSSNTISFYSDSANNSVEIRISGDFCIDKARLKQWNILIYKEINNKQQIVRIFSGGSIPPASITWDGRTANGDLLENGLYKIQLIIIDNLNRDVFSKIKEIKIR